MYWGKHYEVLHRWSVICMWHFGWWTRLREQVTHGCVRDPWWQPFCLRMNLKCCCLTCVVAFKCMQIVVSNRPARAFSSSSGDVWNGYPMPATSCGEQAEQGSCRTLEYTHCPNAQLTPQVLTDFSPPYVFMAWCLMNTETSLPSQTYCCKYHGTAYNQKLLFVAFIKYSPHRRMV